MKNSGSKFMLVIMLLSVFLSMTAAMPMGAAANTSSPEDKGIISTQAGPAPLQEEQADVSPRWTDDVLLAGTDAEEIRPRIASVSNGDLYTVVEHWDDNAIHIFKSTDGGENWYFWFWISSATYDVKTPDIAIGEGVEDWVFVVYEFADQIRVARIAFDLSYWDFHSVDSSPDGVRYPKITTDCIDWNSYYVFVAYDKARNFDDWDLYFARSKDRGASYVDHESIWPYSESYGTIDIAYGDGCVFVSFENIDGPFDWNIYVMRNTLYGNPTYWDPAVQLTWSSDVECDSAVVATHGGGTVVVAYTRLYEWEDFDIWYACSIDNGVLWNRDNWLSIGSYVDDTGVDLAVSRSYGKIHAVYWSGGDINGDVIYKSTDYSTPEFLYAAPPVVINEGGTASGFWEKTNVAVNPTQPTETEACVAWTDERNPTRDVYFDANYLTENPCSYDEYFSSMDYTPFDSDGDGLNDAVELKMDVDTTYAGTITVHAEAELRYNGDTVDSDSVSWSITNAEVEWGYAYLYVPEGSPEGDYTIFVRLFDQCWNSEDFWSMCCVYLYPPAMEPSISIYTDKFSYHTGDTMQLGLEIANPGPALQACVEIWIEKPDSTTQVILHAHDRTLTAGLDYSNPTFRSFGPLPSIPSGFYTWHAALLDPITHDIIVEDTALWEFY